MMNTPILLHDWEKFTPLRVMREFLESEERYDPEKILLDVGFVAFEMLLASYTYQDYEGSAFVLLRKDGNLYEVNASHCSCYELENQWRPEPTTIEELRHRLDKGHLGMTYEHGEYVSAFANELRAVLDHIERQDVLP